MCNAIIIILVFYDSEQLQIMIELFCKYMHVHTVFIKENAEFFAVEWFMFDVLFQEVIFNFLTTDDIKLNVIDADDPEVRTVFLPVTNNLHK